MSIRQLRTLLAIAESGGFSAAAQRLYLTQSAVSMQMKALEEELGTRIFDRASRPPVLNSAGWRLVEEARKILEHYDLLPLTVAAPASGLTGSLRLGVVPSVATHLLPRMLLELREAHAGLRIQVQSGLSPELAFRIEDKRLDLAILTEPERADGALVFEALCEEELKLVIHEDLARGSIAEMLGAYPFVRFNPAMGVGRIIDAMLRARRISVNDVMEFDSIEAMTSIVSLKLGVTIIPVGVVSSVPEPLMAIPFEPAVTRTVGLLARRGTIDAPAVRAVADAFRSIAEAGPAPRGPLSPAPASARAPRRRGAAPPPRAPREG